MAPYISFCHERLQYLGMEPESVPRSRACLLDLSLQQRPRLIAFVSFSKADKEKHKDAEFSRSLDSLFRLSKADKEKHKDAEFTLYQLIVLHKAFQIQC
jgi:hypothetical protein